jgi:hypothetical protein
VTWVTVVSGQVTGHSNTDAKQQTIPSVNKGSVCLALSKPVAIVLRDTALDPRLTKQGVCPVLSFYRAALTLRIDDGYDLQVSG